MYSRILIFMLFYGLISCNSARKEEKPMIAMTKIEIPLIKVNRDNESLKISNGVLYFNDKPYSGIVNDYYPNKMIKSTSEYYRGKKHGFYFGWYQNGNKWFERFYAEGLKTGVHIGWYDNQQQMFTYEFNSDGRYHGSVKDWHMNGQLAKHFNFEHGKEAGSQKMWEIDGSLRANFFTVDGERHGLIGLKNCGSTISKINN